MAGFAKNNMPSAAILVFLLPALTGSDIHLPCARKCSCWFDKEQQLVADCSGRNLHSVPQDLPHSTVYLDLSSNLISTWSMSSITQLRHLRSLDLSKNLIKKVSASLSKEKLSFLTEENTANALSPNYLSLKHLNLHSNQISSLDNFAFAQCMKLKTLDLSRNRLTKLQPNSLRGLFQLKVLELQGNCLDLRPETYPLNLFADLARLESLNIQRNYPPDGLSTQWLPLNTETYAVTNATHVNDERAYPDEALSLLSSLKVLRMDALPVDILPGPGFKALHNLTILDFNGSRALKGLPELFFSNFSIQEPLHLILSECDLKFIHPNSFTYLPTLYNLSLHNNEALEFSGFEIGSRGLQNTSVKIIDISRIHRVTLIRLKGKYFQYVRYLALEELKFERNNILIIGLSAMGYLPSTLKKLSIGENKLNDAKFLIGTERLAHLEMLNISVQNKFKYHSGKPKSFSENLRRVSTSSKDITKKRLKRITHVISKSVSTRGAPSDVSQEIQAVSEDLLVKLRTELCASHGNSFFETLPLHISTRMFKVHKAMVSFCNPGENMTEIFDAKRFFSDVIFLPVRVRLLYGSQLKLGFALPKMSFQPRNVVETLDLSKNFLWCLGGPVNGFRRLKTLDLSSNYCIFLSPHFFGDMWSLQTLNLAQNVLGPSLETDTDGITFSSLLSLEWLDLSNCEIRFLHPNLFLSNQNLNVLLLNNNAMHTFELEMSHLNNLSFIDLSYNDLKVLPRPTLVSLDLMASTNQNITIDLSENPMVCDCSTLSFTLWIKTARVNFKGFSTYRCQYIDGSTVLLSDAVGQLMPATMRLCFGQTIFTGVLVVFSVLVVAVTAAAIYCHFSSRLLFLVYISKRRYFNSFTDPEQHGIRDVFVVFDNEHRTWRRFVARVLKPALERRGVSCYISEIDALAGRPIRLVVEEAVFAGKKTLVLLSRSLFECDEKELEINMALLAEQMRVTEVLTFLYLEELSMEHIPKHIQRILQDRQAFCYPGNYSRFWDDFAQYFHPGD